MSDTQSHTAARWIMSMTNSNDRHNSTKLKLKIIWLYKAINISVFTLKKTGVFVAGNFRYGF
jgi:hypothetical protein